VPLVCGGVRGDEALTGWYEAATEGLPPLELFDAHTHLGGNDPDGFRLEADALLDALSAANSRAVVFPMNEPDGDYRGANRTVIADAAASSGRLVPFCRLDPYREPVAEASVCVEEGARGIKLHPRAERFDLDLPAVGEIFGFAEDRGLPVLVHSGGGMAPLAGHVLALTTEFPEVPLILAHAGISDLTALWRRVDDCPNLFFDSSWWNAADLLALFALVPPGRVLYGSDMPYETPLQNAVVALRCALQVGVRPECLPSIMGLQLRRLVDGERAEDLGPAPGASRVRSTVLLRRVYADLVCAIAEMRIGETGYEGLMLARRACDGADGTEEELVLRSVLALLDLHESYVSRNPVEPAVAHAPGYPLVVTAAAVAATPDAPVPAPDG
jgi:predicted TIM-barrel fold metal-dependent hydrolase